MLDLIGRPYRFGADGTDPDGALDCIHLVYLVLQRLRIPHPAFDPAWYTAPPRDVLSALSRWGTRIELPQYDGDVVLLPHTNYAFGVTWEDGILYTAEHLYAVNWQPLRVWRPRRSYRCASFPTSAN